MKLDFRQRLLTTTLLVGASMVASPAIAQTTPNPPDTATGNQPETTTPVEGQTTVPSVSATGEQVREAQDIVITGTRIPQPNLTSASPVTVLTSQEVKLSGTSRTEDLINSLPQSFAAQGSNVSNGATGTATVNLRGLGTSRTLVLVNGRRLQPGDPRAGGVTPDINFIPSSLVKRVDVLTGGASSVYGADAVAGVVNFIMDTNFRGLRIDGQLSTFNHQNRGENCTPNANGFSGGTCADFLAANANSGFLPPRHMSTNGGAQDISVAFGAGFDDNRGSIMAYATYRKQDAVLESTRDYSFCALGANPAYNSDPNTDFYCGGSSTNALGRFRRVDQTDGVGTQSFTLAGPGSNQFVPGFAAFNFAPYNYFQRPDERYTLGAFAEYEISPGAKPYLEAMFMDDHSDAQIAPSGDFANTTTLNCDNPLLSTQQFNTICIPGNTFVDANGITQANLIINRRNVEGGGRDDDLEHIAYRLVAGVRGDLLKGLSYDAYYQFGTTRLAETYLNDFSVVRLGRALDVVANPAVGGVAGVPAGTPVCRSALGANPVDANCVPWNIFGSPLIAGGVTQEALNYLQTPGFQRGNVNETVANANVTLDGTEYGLQLPWADRGVAVNVGGEYRKESLKFNTDIEFSSGDLAGQGGPTLPNSGSFDVRELFGEVQIPIVSHSFIEEFTLTGGYRYSDYKVNNNHFSTDTYKISAELAPVHDVRFRASYNRAVRAPNIVELFFPSTLGLSVGRDFCAGATPDFTLAQCLNTGITAAQYGNIDANPANQYNSQFSGNATLTPEKADTYTVGVVLQPRWIPGLAVTVDYYNIKVKNSIAALSFNGVLATCALTADPGLCALIHRDATGSLTTLATGFIELPTQNVGGMSTKGIDVNASYSRRLGGMGTLNLSFVGTYLKDLIFDTGISPNAFGMDGVYNCAGLYGASCSLSLPFTSPNMKWRHKLRAGFTLPMGLGISGQWRYFSSVKKDSTSGDPDLNLTQGPHSFPANEKVKAQSFFDLALTARVADRYNFRMGANNIFDKEPPLMGGDVSSNGNTYPQTYDALGRYLFAGVTIDF
jgi:outer membrane receptor protein involved in Fe transport